MRFLAISVRLRLLCLLLTAAMVGAPGRVGAQGPWESLAPLPTAGEEVVGVSVGGKIYVLAGLGGLPNYPGVGMVYEYNPGTNTWIKKKPMPIPAHHIMAAEYNGKIYVFGGFVQVGPIIAWQPIDNSWEYSPDTDTWKPLAPLPSKRGAGGAVVAGGKIYVIGGADVSPGATDPVIRFAADRPHVTVDTNEEYDPATNTWRARRPMPTPRNHFFAGEVGGKVYVIGGRIASAFITRASNTDIVEEYNPATDGWAQKASMPTARSAVGGGVYKGRLYVAGGEAQTEKAMMAFRAFEAYEPATNRWHHLPSMRIPRHGLAAGFVGSRFHVISGDVQTAGIPGVTVYTNAHEAIDVDK